MKKLFLIVLIFFSFCVVNAKETKYPKEIKEVLEVFINCLNNSDEDVYSLVDSSNKELIGDIKKQINDITFTYDIKYIRKKDENYYRIKTTFSASGDHWSTSGFSAWFDLKEIDGAYKISDTNLFNKVGLEYISSVVIIAFCIAIVIFVLPFLCFFIKGIFWKNKKNTIVNLSNHNKPYKPL